MRAGGIRSTNSIYRDVRAVRCGASEFRCGVARHGPVRSAHQRHNRTSHVRLPSRASRVSPPRRGAGGDGVCPARSQSRARPCAGRCRCALRWGPRPRAPAAGAAPVRGGGWRQKSFKFHRFRLTTYNINNTRVCPRPSQRSQSFLHTRGALLARVPETGSRGRYSLTCHDNVSVRAVHLELGHAARALQVRLFRRLS